MTLINKEKPSESPQKKAAFANSVAYLVTGESGGYGGPSIREHSVSWSYHGGNYTFQEAVKLLLDGQGLIFGPLSQIHIDCFNSEFCFDDDQKDLELLQPKS